jgi:uncharacterized protein YcaQ
MKVKSAKRSVGESLDTEQARLLALSSQGLLSPAFGKGRSGALKAVTHLGYVQIDTLSVASRSHHHVLWSRVPGYTEAMLAQMAESDRSIFEYWSHAASFLPMSEYRFSLPRKAIYAEGGSHWFSQDKKMKKFVLDRIRKEGPLQSRDFEFVRSSPGNWYDWKPAKKALEQLFMEGRLMVSARKGFQKVYDLTERVLPPGTDETMPSPEEYARFLVLKSLQANGIATLKEFSYLRPGMAAPVAKAVKELVSEGKIREIAIQGQANTPYYITIGQHLPDAPVIDDVLNILSPFDNVLIQRKRLQAIFNFDYQIECYLPESKRKYGYFTLPVLYRGNFVARFDPKADRKEKVFHVKVMHFEKGFRPDAHFNKLFAAKIKQYAMFNGCDTVIVADAERKWKKEFTAELKRS